MCDYKTCSLCDPVAFGFLVNSRRKEQLAECRTLLGLDAPATPYIANMEAFLAKQGIDPGLCPVCGEGRMRNVYLVLSFHDPPARYLEAA